MIKEGYEIPETQAGLRTFIEYGEKELERSKEHCRRLKEVMVICRKTLAELEFKKERK